MRFISQPRIQILSICVVFATCQTAGNSSASPPQSDGAESIRVMSFNVRYGKAKDGPNHWDQRKRLVIETIREFDPDILGTQEMMSFQADFFRQHLPEFAYHGTSRIPADIEQEQCAIFYRTSRFEQINAGHFWLSDTPDQPGTISWDSSFPRMVSWIKLRSQQDDEGVFFVFNTHFDHIGQEARLQSAALLRQRILSIAGGAPAIVTGDFNSAEGSLAHRVLLFPTKQLALTDTYQTARAGPATAGESTSSRWNGNRAGGRIDWILCTEHWKVLKAAIDRSNDGGRYPSDHYPVTAILRRAVEKPAEPSLP